jgi:hypothetical protein
MILEKSTLQDAREELGTVLGNNNYAPWEMDLRVKAAQAQALIVIAEQLTKVNDNLVRLVGRMP